MPGTTPYGQSLNEDALKAFLVIQRLILISKHRRLFKEKDRMSSLTDLIDLAHRQQSTTQASVPRPRLMAALRLLLAPASVREGTHPDDTTVEPDVLQQLLKQFEERGYDGIVRSWLSTGDNEPINADQVGAALGTEKVTDIAGRTGLAPEMLLQELARLLPAIVDLLSPQGALPARGSFLRTADRPS
jgi:uncharacterized protein YidB (DUF937 family)